MEELAKIVESNAKAIAALTSDLQEMKRDRDTMYTLMRDLAQNQSRIYEVMQNQDQRQQQLTDQQRQLSNQQQQLIEIIKSMNK
jgi:predicted  nucleic acid-binding Zn-ribbon protein